MKAIIKLTNNDIIDVVGKDLNICFNGLTSVLEVVDRAASNRVVFSTRQYVKCAYILDCEDLPVCNMEAEENQEIIVHSDNTDYKGCMLVNNCNFKTATCHVCEPDVGCYPYRYIKKIIEKENAKMEDNNE